VSFLSYLLGSSIGAALFAGLLSQWFPFGSLFPALAVVCLVLTLPFYLFGASRRAAENRREARADARVRSLIAHSRARAEPVPETTVYQSWKVEVDARQIHLHGGAGGTDGAGGPQAPRRIIRRDGL
jgi:hypothetical protein